MMKNLKDLRLPKKYECRVAEWLEQWLDLLVSQAKGREGTVYRADFERQDFFYFTDCTDILSKDPEAKGYEDNRAIQTRKRLVMTQLFVKTLLGREVGRKIKCSHCGYGDVYIDALPDGGGNFRYCPKCQNTVLNVYPMSYDSCIAAVKGIVGKKFGPSLGGKNALALLKEVENYKRANANLEKKKK